MSMPPTTRRELLTPVKGRWTWLRKFWICHGLEHGVITFEEARQYHTLGADELNGWLETYRTEGANGFRRQSPNPWRYAA